MNSHVGIEPVEFFRDARGWVIEPVDEALLAGKRNVHVVWSESGAVRGNHYHERATEIFVVVGPALIRLRESGVTRDIPVPDGRAMRFTVPPGVPHAIQNTGARPMILMSFTDQPHDRVNPDTHPTVLIETCSGRSEPSSADRTP
jgi:dTDP-4-dehydrorhamnose 3,5-epimerase-like enzyme